ncbi:MAG: DUF4013 domain-containing protein [Pseudomonadota bacterium]
MSVIGDSAPATLANAGQGGWLLRWVASLIRFIVAVVLCLNALTAILVLGWLMRTQRGDIVARRLRLEDPTGGHPKARLQNWLIGTDNSQGFLRRWFGGLIENARDGVASLLTLLAGTLPFTLLWMFSWWGGWENSFNKGYEQSWVGPAIGGLGILIALPILTYLPMALAHQAAESRMSAFFAIGTVKRLIRHVWWRYFLLCLMIVLLTFPLFAAKSLPVFVENWYPRFVSFDQDEAASFATTYRLVTTFYLVFVIVIWRRAAARLYARAAVRLEKAGKAGPKATWLAMLLRTLLFWVVWFGLVAQVFVGQFVNHQWTAWINHPTLILPWLPPLGASL